MEAGRPPSAAGGRPCCAAPGAGQAAAGGSASAPSAGGWGARRGGRRRGGGGGGGKALPPKKKPPGAPRPRKAPRPVTVDSAKARTSLEALRISLRALRWKEFPFGRRLPCDIYWHAVSFHENTVFSGQVNKFPGMSETVRKVPLSRAVRTMQELFPEEYNFYPRSWILPEEFTIFLAEVQILRERSPAWKPTFIVKPDGGCQGGGIYLVQEPTDVRLSGSLQSRPAVVQEYIARPLLLEKLKFDLRLYVLLRSLEPLEVYVAKEGLSRFCTEPYQEPALRNLHRVFMHLTNYSLNVHSGGFVHSDSGSTGSKRSLSSVLGRLAEGGVDVRKLWSEILALVVKTVIALVPELKVHHQADIPSGKPGPSCFQILGFDILLMKTLKPVLLEVNANPSMKIEHEKEVSPGVFEYIPSPVDEGIKVAVIRDTLRLVDPRKKKKKQKDETWPAQPAEATLEGKEDLLEDEPLERPEPEPEPSLPALCLKQVLPKYAQQFGYLRLVERIAALFLRFLGLKGTTKLGPTGFRTFVRQAKISNSSFSMAAADILYIDIARKSSSLGLDQRDAGMGLQAFVEAFCFLAQRRYKSLSLHERVELLVDFCEYNVAALDEKRGRQGPERRAALVTCQPGDRLHLSPTPQASPQTLSTTIHKCVDCRSPRP